MEINFRRLDAVQKELEDAFSLEASPEDSPEAKELWKIICRGRKATDRTINSINKTWMRSVEIQEIFGFINDILEIIIG